jgi:hypothetical protein
MSWSWIKSSLFSGVYSIIVYYFVKRWWSPKHYLLYLGFEHKWMIFICLLFAFGYIKHEIGYYTKIDHAYCKQTDICKKNAEKKAANLTQKAENILGFEENIWLEAAGEGVIFALVGVPLFLLCRSEYTAAFATGIIANLIAGKTGINASFCKTGCNSTISTFFLI